MAEDLQRLIGWFLWYLDCTIEELARRAGVDESSVRRWKKGISKPRRASLEALAKVAGLSMTFIDAVVLPGIATVRLGQAAEEEVFRDLAEAARVLEGSLSGVVQSAVAELVAFLEEEPIGERENAREQCERLKGCAPEDLWYLVEVRPEFQTRELALLLALESEEAASADASRALLLARVAQRVTALVEGGEHGKSALEGLIMAILANAHRVANEPVEAERAFEGALARWAAADEAERATLPEWRFLDLEGSHRREQRQFSRALELFTRARALAPPEAIPRILVKRAVTLEKMGDSEGAIEVLEEAAFLVGPQGPPRDRLNVLFNLAANLSLLERFEEADSLLPTVQELAAGAPRLVRVRTVWLGARIGAGRGRLEHARAAFDEVRQEFHDRRMAADYALASLERAELDLRQGRYAEVRALAEEMKWIFKAKGIHREALAALRLFREAAAREQATAELAHRVVRYLYRAQHDPDLKFAA